jgi:hypothetical protein
VSPWDRRRDGRAALLIFLLVLGVYLLTAEYTINQVNDARDTATSAWSLGTRGTLALPQEWAEWGPEDEHLMRWAAEGRDGRTYTNRFPGPILWGAPFYSATEVLSPRGEVEHPWLVNFAPGGVAAATAGALAVTVGFAVYRRLANRRLAIGAALTLAFATGMWSVAGDALWTHGPGSLMLLLGVLAMSYQRHARAGFAFAVSLLCRPQLAVVPAVMGIWAGARRRSLRPIIVVGLCSVLGLIAMSLYSQVLFGTWLPVAGYSTTRIDNIATTGPLEFARRIGLALIHPQRGLLLYTPLLLLLLPGVHRGWRAAPDWVRSAAVAGLAYLVVQFRANNWTGGADHFGSRLTLEALVLASPLLLVVFQRFIRTTPLLLVMFSLVLVLSVGLHALGATVLETGLHGIDGVGHWRDNFVDLCESDPQLCDPPPRIPTRSVIG